MWLNYYVGSVIIITIFLLDLWLVTRGNLNKKWKLNYHPKMLIKTLLSYQWWLCQPWLEFCQLRPMSSYQFYQSVKVESIGSGAILAGFKSQLLLLLISCVTLVKLFNFSVPHFPHQHSGNICNRLKGCLEEFIDSITVNLLKRYLTHSKHSVNVSCFYYTLISL